MSFLSTAAHSSRIKKSRKPSSPFAALPRRKPISTPETSRDDEDDFFDDLLKDVGLVKALATDLTLRDVAQAIKYIRRKLWSEIPAQRAGMNSTRIAEVLNFRARLPPIVTVSHTQALLNSPTTVEREIAELIRSGTIRKIMVGGRGTLGEVLILVEDMDKMIRESPLTPSLKETYFELLHKHPTALTLSPSWLSEEDAQALVHAGFLTSANAVWNPADVFSRPSEGSRGTSVSLSSISRAASGSLAAVGGEGAVYESGGSGGGARLMGGSELSVSLPGIGPILKLLANAQTHLISLLSKSKSREAPERLLRQRWDGGVAVDDTTSTAKRNRARRGEFAGVLPGRTRKWKQFYGLTFDCVLGEALGAGIVEVFDTGNSTIGRGVRSLQNR